MEEVHLIYIPKSSDLLQHEKSRVRAESIKSVCEFYRTIRAITSLSFLLATSILNPCIRNADVTSYACSLHSIYLACCASRHL